MVRTAAFSADRCGFDSRPGCLLYRVPDPERHLEGVDPERASWARCVIVEYLAGDLTVAQLDAELDWHLRGIQPPRARRLATM